MAAPDYSAWPVVSDVFDLLASANIVPTLSSTSQVAQMYIDSASQGFEQATKREFIAGDPDTPVTRYFDGTGTGVMFVDAYRSISQISFVLTPLQGVVQPLSAFEFEAAQYPKTRIQILQGPTNVSYGWWTYFPQGRSNVEITGVWGYADTIPAPVWMAVLMKAAANIADANRAKAGGLVTSIKDDDTGLTYSDKQIAEIAGWKSAYDDAVRLYRRPLRDYLRRSTRPLI